MNVGLTDWLNNGWLTEHHSSPQEIEDLFGIADRDLSDCQTPGLSADWRLNIAYNSALQAATAALAAAGFRVTRQAHHFRVIYSLTHTINLDSKLIAQFDQFRKKRNIGGYERAGAVSDQEAKEMMALARKIRELTEQWIQNQHPELLK
jgi:hypothetical protein